MNSIVRYGDRSAAALALILAPVALAFAAGVQSAMGLLDLGWQPWAEVFGLALAGWFMSSAETLAGWVDGEKTELLRNRLKILRLLSLSMGAGMVAFLLGTVGGMPGILNAISVLLAAYGGEQYLRRRMDQSTQEPKGGNVNAGH